MTAGVEEVLVELLGELEHLCHWSQLGALGEVPEALVFRREVLSAAVTAKTRLEKVRLGVVAA